MTEEDTTPRPDPFRAALDEALGRLPYALVFHDDGRATLETTDHGQEIEEDE